MTTADFTAKELATLARFDATPAAPESWGGGLREGAAREMWAADVDLPVDLLSGETPSRYYQLADAALTVLAAHLGQQQATIDRVKALADELEALRAAGTPGPWALHPAAADTVVGEWSEGGEYGPEFVNVADCRDEWPRASAALESANAALIAAAVNAISHIRAAVEVDQ